VIIGTIKSFVSASGYGFITVPNLARDVFVHAADLCGAACKHERLHAGDVVVIDRIEGEAGDRPRALGVRLADDDLGPDTGRTFLPDESAVWRAAP
jgi:cold shock CspA family protein